MPRRPLRAVPDDDVVVDVMAPGPISRASRSGSTRDALAATRDRIAAALDSDKTLARDLASLSKRLMEVMKEIEAIDARGDDEGGVHVEASSGDEPWSPI